MNVIFCSSVLLSFQKSEDGENFSSFSKMTFLMLNLIFRILFMDHGEVAEYDNPQALLENPKSRFFNLVNGETNSTSS